MVRFFFCYLFLFESDWISKRKRNFLKRFTSGANVISLKTKRNSILIQICVRSHVREVNRRLGKFSFFHISFVCVKSQAFCVSREQKNNNNNVILNKKKQTIKSITLNVFGLSYWSLRALHCSFQSVQFPFCGSRFVQHIYFFIFICYKFKNNRREFYSSIFTVCTTLYTLRFCLISMLIYHYSTRLSHTHTFTLTFSKRTRFIFFAIKLHYNILMHLSCNTQLTPIAANFCDISNHGTNNKNDPFLIEIEA